MKKKILLLLTVLAGVLSAHAANGVTVSEVTVPKGGTGTISIALNNDDYTFTAFSFKLTLPEGISFVLDANGKPTFTQGARFDDHGLSSSASGQTGTFGCLSLSNAPISGTSGVLLTVNVTADASLNVGTKLNATLSELTFTTPAEQEVNFADVNFNITVGEPDDGRIHFDETSTTLPTYTAGEKGDVTMVRTIRANEWSTIVLPFTLTKAKAEAAFGTDVQLAEFAGFEVDYGDDEENVVPLGISLNFSTYTMSTKKSMTGGKPFLIKTSKLIEKIEADDVTLFAAVTDVSKTDEYDTTGKFTGTLVKTKVPADGLFLSENEFWYSTGLTNIKAFRGWFELGAVLNKETDFSANIRYNVIDEEASGISDIAAKQKKGVYTLQGVALGEKDVKRLPKGVYVVDGKKVVK